MTKERPKRGTLPPARESVHKLENIVIDGNYYGAQQMYKSTTARYVSAERYTEALDILQSGACIQLRHGQVTCGSELATLFVGILVKGKFPCNEENIDVGKPPRRREEKSAMTEKMAKNIYKEFPQIPVPHHLGVDDNDMQKLTEALGAAKVRVDGCSSFLKAAIRWSAEFGGPRDGSPDLHDMLAEYLFSECPELDMARISAHYVRGNNPKKFASALVNFMGKCYPGEDDVAIARAVLMYLSLGNLRDANCVMDELRKQVQSTELDFPQTDLTQFIIYLLQTLERDALPLFRMLRQNYKSSIDRDTSFNELLDEVAEKFYGVRRRNPLQGMFGDFFKMLGGGDVAG